MSKERKPYNYNSNKKTNYQIPSKQLGFGSKRKLHFESHQTAVSETELSVPLQYYEQAFELQQTYKSLIDKVINRTIKIKSLQREAKEFAAYEFIVDACYTYKSSSEIDLITWVLYKLKRRLLTWLKRELKQKPAPNLKHKNKFSALIVESQWMYIVEERLDPDGDKINKELAEILLNFVKYKVHPFEYRIYYLSYCCGLSDVEISNEIGMERSRITKARNKVIKLIIHYKDEIEKLFE